MSDTSISAIENRTLRSIYRNGKIVPFLVLALLQAGDLFSTRMALTIPGVMELNPLVRELGLWPAKLLVLGFIALLVYRTKSRRRLWAACGVYALIVASNILVFVTHA
ncbi:MAG: DUF5658 family protein [Candidatus Korobacteraceae bacterium]|jgi:hypothetical protein